MRLFVTQMPGNSYDGPLLELSKQEKKTTTNLKETVKNLSHDIGERNIWHYEELDAAAAFIADKFKQLNFQVKEQSFLVDGREVKNIATELAGSNSNDEIIILGAHYDSCFGTPGANDNASGVAALLELAQMMKEGKRERTIRFVAFVNEEPPFFQTKKMGSYVYAHNCRKLEEKIIAMISLETIGFYTQDTGSQKYPFPFSLFYPSIGNFIGFVGNLESQELVHSALAAFRKNTKFPSQGIAAAHWLPGVGWSDQWAFWKHNYPAIMITDTAPYRYPHYHSVSDTAEKINYECTARVITGLKHVVFYLANKFKRE